jgi:hypothetical protein
MRTCPESAFILPVRSASGGIDGRCDGLSGVEALPQHPPTGDGVTTANVILIGSPGVITSISLFGRG